MPRGRNDTRPVIKEDFEETSYSTASMNATDPTVESDKVRLDVTDDKKGKARPATGKRKHGPDGMLDLTLDEPESALSHEQSNLDGIDSGNIVNAPVVFCTVNMTEKRGGIPKAVLQSTIPPIPAEWVGGKRFKQTTISNCGALNIINAPVIGCTFNMGERKQNPKK